MKTSRFVKGYLAFELIAIVIFGFLLTPTNGANVFLLGPRTGLVVAIFAIFLNPLIGIVGLFVAGSELKDKNRAFLVIALLVLSIAFTTLFPIAAAEHGVSKIFGMLFAV